MAKPWTVSRSPVGATPLDVARAEAINRLLRRPVGVLPITEGDPVRPFARGLFNEMRQLLKPEEGVTALRRATAAYVYSKRYYFASAQPDSFRHDLEGSPVEELTLEDRLAAQHNFLQLKKLHGKSGNESPAPSEPSSQRGDLSAEP